MLLWHLIYLFNIWLLLLLFVGMACMWVCVFILRMASHDIERRAMAQNISRCVNKLLWCHCSLTTICVWLPNTWTNSRGGWFNCWIVTFIVWERVRCQREAHNVWKLFRKTDEINRLCARGTMMKNKFFWVQRRAYVPMWVSLSVCVCQYIEIFCQCRWCDVV